MIDLYDQIHQLRCELRGCRFTRRERAVAKAQLDQLSPNTPNANMLSTALREMDNTELTGVE